MLNAFNETRNLFRDYTNYSHPLSYDEWSAIADEYKAAVLFVQFFDQITLAWYNTKSFFVVEEDGVSCVLQYLSKNVPILKENPKRFTPGYIYKVAYNCLYCISHDIKRDIDRYHNETSNIVISGEDELDLFDTVMSNDLEYTDAMSSASFWNVIESMGPETLKVVNHLLTGASLKKAKMSSKAKENAQIFQDKQRMAAVLEGLSAERQKEKLNSYHAFYIQSKNLEIDPLKDIEVSVEQAEKIIEELKEKLEAFKSLYY